MCSPCLCTLSASGSIHPSIPTFGRFLLEILLNFLPLEVGRVDPPGRVDSPGRVGSPSPPGRVDVPRSVGSSSPPGRVDPPRRVDPPGRVDSPSSPGRVGAIKCCCEGCIIFEVVLFGRYDATKFCSESGG